VQSENPTSSSIHDSGTVRQLGGQVIDITAQTPQVEDIILTRMTIRVYHRSIPPKSGVTVIPPCSATGPSGTFQPGDFDIDLDAAPVQISAVSSSHTLDGTPLPMLTFPFKVSSTDPVEIHLSVSDLRCDCEFAVVIYWVDNGQFGQTIVDDGGSHFHVVPDGSYPTYWIPN
jgi:hypothetical protein